MDLPEHRSWPQITYRSPNPNPNPNRSSAVNCGVRTDRLGLLVWPSCLQELAVELIRPSSWSGAYSSLIGLIAGSECQRGWAPTQRALVVRAKSAVCCCSQDLQVSDKFEKMGHIWESMSVCGILTRGVNLGGRTVIIIHVPPEFGVGDAPRFWHFLCIFDILSVFSLTCCLYILDEMPYFCSTCKTEIV